MNEKEAKKYILIFSTGLLSAGALIMALAYILDPFQVFHPSYFVKDKYIKGYERYQNAGLINRMLEKDDCCEAAIIGSSMSQNFMPSYVEKVFKIQGVLHISLPGPVPPELAALQRRASQAKEIKLVIMDALRGLSDNEVALLDQPGVWRRPDKYFSLKLYDNNLFNDFMALSSIDIFPHFLRLVFDSVPYEEIQPWYDGADIWFGNADKVAAINPNVTEKHLPDSFSGYEFPNLEKIWLPMIKEHPEQTFYIYLPPYSRHYYASMTEDEYVREMALIYFLAKELDSLPNARLFGYDMLFTSVDDLNDYKDLMHYSEKTSRRIIDSMADGKGRITGRNVENYIRQVTDRTNTYTRNFNRKKR